MLKAIKIPDNARLGCTYKGKYCQTHRAYGDSSANYKDKAPGYRDEATKKNKIDGSKAQYN